MLRKDQFHLFDKGKEQNVEVDVSFYPISLVIALQSNSHVDGMLPKVQKIGNLIQPLIVGEGGTARCALSWCHQLPRPGLIGT